MRLKTRANMCNTPGPQQPGNNNNEILKPGGGEPEPEPSGAEPEKDASTATNGKEGRESGSAGYSGPTGGLEERSNSRDGDSEGSSNSSGSASNNSGSSTNKDQRRVVSSCEGDVKTGVEISSAGVDQENTAKTAGANGSNGSSTVHQPKVIVQRQEQADKLSLLPELTTDVALDRKRRLIGDEFFNRTGSASADHPDGNVSIIVTPSPDGDGNGLIYGAASSAGHDGETTKDSQQQQPGTVGNPSVSPPGITSVAVHHQTNTNLVTFSGGHTTTTTTGLTEEEILKRLESEALSNDGSGNIILYTSDGTLATTPSTIIDKLGLAAPGGPAAVSEFIHQATPTSAPYMASLIPQDVKNEPEDLTGARRESTGHPNDDGPENLQNLSNALKLSTDKSAPVVVSTPEGPLVLTPADGVTANATFHPTGTSEGGPTYVTSPEFGTFESPRPLGFGGGDPYGRHPDAGEIYSQPHPEFATPGRNPGGGPGGHGPEGQFIPYYKVAPGGAPGGPHIPSPDSGIGDLNASQQESFSTYPDSEILNDIGGTARKPWHDYSRQNEEKVNIPKLNNHYGFKYTLESPTSSSVRREDDRITYVNKGQFYPITLEYSIDPEVPPLKSSTVKSVIMVVFRDGKTPEEEMKAWNFWHTRQHSVKQRILDADTKNSAGLVGHIEEISHNALAVYWNPLESQGKVSLAVQCLSTDFSTQKGVKGLPLHIQIDTYEDPRETVGQNVYHRGYCQIKVFCDKGAERKARDEERRAQKRKLNASGKRRLDDMYHTTEERSFFYSRQDTLKQPILFTPTTDPTKAALEFGTELPSFYSPGPRGSPPEQMLKLNGSNGSPPANPDSTPSAPPPAQQPPVDLKPDFEALKPLLPGSTAPPPPPPAVVNLGPVVHYPPDKRPKLMPPLTERVMIYVRQESEEAFTALHLVPPTAEGLIRALENKYNINARNIHSLYRKNKEGHVVKMDDEMITYYTNEDAFLMTVVVTEDPSGNEALAQYDITLTEL